MGSGRGSGRGSGAEPHGARQTAVGEQVSNSAAPRPGSSVLLRPGSAGAARLLQAPAPRFP